jgi:hypothetical protein
MNKYAEVNIDNFPIVVVTFTGAAAQVDNFPYYLDEVKKSYDCVHKVAIIFNADNAVMPGLAYQKMQAQWLKDNNQLMKDYCVGTAYIIKNVIIRNVLKAIFTLQKQPVPYLISANITEAEDWVKEQLANALDVNNN